MILQIYLIGFILCWPSIAAVMHKNHAKSHNLAEILSTFMASFFMSVIWPWYFTYRIIEKL